MTKAMSEPTTEGATRTSLPFGRSLLGRMVLLGVVPTVLVMGAVVTANGIRSYDSLKQSGTAQLEDVARRIARRIEDENRRAVQVSRMVAIAQLNGLFGDRHRTVEFHRELLLAHPDLFAVTVCYEPNADGKDQDPGNDSLPDVLDANGRFVPYVRRDPSRPEGFRFEPLSGYDDPEVLWYQGTKREWERTGRIEPFLTRPYVYEGEQMVEQMVPLVRDGTFLGIAGCDRSLRTIEEELAKIRAEDGVEVFVIARGHFAGATVDLDRSDATALRTRPVAGTGLERLIGSPGTLERPRIFDAVNPLDGEASFVATAAIPTGDWTVVLTRPEREVMAPAWRSLVLGGLTALAGIVVVAGLLVAFARRISGRLRTAVEASCRIAEGDLSRDPPPATAGDETGELLRAFRRMSDQLNRLVGQVRQSSIQINSTATELAATSRRQEETVGAFGSATTEIAASVRQISTTGTELLGTMEAIGERAVQSAELAQESRRELAGMEGSMRKLEDATATVAARLAAINEKASGITAIVTTINQVADQTNLLSVNAAIEAEKAGEFGVGFLVVAREIRRLADQTAGATLDIERMVKQMQSAVSGGVMEMDRFAETVRAGVDEVVKVSSRLGRIIEQVSESTESFQVVNEGMRSQAAGAGQIDGAMRGLDSAARQTATASAEFGQAAEDLQAAVGSLKTSIANFRLRN
jgi:methyl-accepting chemotaxis protein WspA